MKRAIIISIVILFILLLGGSIIYSLTVYQDNNEENGDKYTHIFDGDRAVIDKRISNLTGNLSPTNFFKENDPSAIGMRILGVFNRPLERTEVSEDNNTILLKSINGEVSIFLDDKNNEGDNDRNTIEYIKADIQEPETEFSDEKIKIQTTEVFRSIGMDISPKDNISIRDFYDRVEVSIYQTVKGNPIWGTRNWIQFIYNTYPYHYTYKYDRIKIFIQPRYSGLEELIEGLNETEFNSIAREVDFEVLRENVSDLYDLTMFHYNRSLELIPILEFRIFDRTLCYGQTLFFSLNEDILLPRGSYFGGSLDITIYIDVQTKTPISIIY